MRALFGPLRSEFLFPTIRLAIASASRIAPDRFRIIHFSVQFDHLHLIVEARGRVELSAGMRSLSIRIARSINELLMRKGRFWADRWHGRALKSPREVRNAIAYVLANFRKHAGRPIADGIDPYSSGADFDGWREWQPGLSPPPFAERPLPGLRPIPVLRARTWLAASGFRRAGLISIRDSPRGGGGSTRNPTH